MDHQSPIPPATFLEGSYRYLARQIHERFVMIGLLGGLYGLLTIVFLLSIYGLARRARRKDPTSIVLCFALLGLFTSTTIHVSTNILFHISNILSAVITSRTALWSYGGYLQIPVFPADVVTDYSRAQACASTAALTVNITLGDAIVCWRACAVWNRHRAVTASCAALVCATFALGVAATALSCSARVKFYTDCAVLFTTGVMYERFPAGIAACVLSLVTNGVATGLVAYKAWESRTRLKGYLVAGPRAAQVEKLLALLVESGVGYSALWVVIVAFQFTQYAPPGPASGPAVNSFLDIFGVVVNGALVPAIAIYPALIVVLVALDRSHIDKAFMDRDKCALDALELQLGQIAVETNTNALGLDGNQFGHSPVARAELPLIELGGSEVGRVNLNNEDSGDTDTWNACDGARRKPEGTV